MRINLKFYEISISLSFKLHTSIYINKQHENIFITNISLKIKHIIFIIMRVRTLIHVHVFILFTDFLVTVFFIYTFFKKMHIKCNLKNPVLYKKIVAFLIL
jgi:hypothetical protein